MNRAGRNDPCPCGSGKKYKKCCMTKDAAQGSDVSLDEAEIEDHEQVQLSAHKAEIENNFRRACNYLERNEFEEAAKIFRSVLLLDHSHYRAMTGLGRCLAEMGMHEEACKCFENALKVNPNYTQASINLKLYKSHDT